jgi:hypothetical protein
MLKVNPTRTKRKILLRFMILIALCIVLFTALFGCHVELFQPQKLAQAKSLWDSKNTLHYREVVFTDFAEIKMEVQNNQVISAIWRKTIIPNQSFETVNQEKTLSGTLQNYTIDALFKRAASTIRNVGIIDINGRSNLDFDARLGFISTFAISDCGHGGLLSGGVNDCYWGVTVKSVDLLN